MTTVWDLPITSREWNDEIGCNADISITLPCDNTICDWTGSVQNSMLLSIIQEIMEMCCIQGSMIKSEIEYISRAKCGETLSLFIRSFFKDSEQISVSCSARNAQDHPVAEVKAYMRLPGQTGNDSSLPESH
jgi:hypothetical protein